MILDLANNCEALEDVTLLRLVSIKASQLTWTKGFSQADREDIRQDLLLDCFVRLRNFDPAKSSRITFLRRVVKHRIATLLEAQRASCRDYRRCRASLNDRVQFEDESVELGETVSVDDYEARIGRSKLSPQQRVELQIDIASVISRLPAELIAVAVLLRSVTVVEAARRLRVSRSTLCRRLASIREAFIGVGLDGCYIRHSRFSRPPAGPTLGPSVPLNDQPRYADGERSSAIRGGNSQKPQIEGDIMRRDCYSEASAEQGCTAGVARYIEHRLPWNRFSKQKRASLIQRKPSLVANAPDLSALANEVWAHIKDLNKPPFLFRREGKLCRIEADDTGAPIPVNVDAIRAQYFLVEMFEWKRTERGKHEDNVREKAVNTRPPKDLAVHLVANPDPPVPILQRIVTAPIFTATGRLLCKPGDYADGVLYLPPKSFRLNDVPSRPRADDIRTAVDFLKNNVLRDFYFETEAEKDNSIAALITSFVREMIAGPTPLFWVDKSKGGAGGTLLSMAIAVPLLGAPPAGVNAPRDEAEWNRLILSTLLRSPNVFFVDNCNEYLSSAALAQAITAPRYEGRIIGSSKNGSVEVRCLWLINGNNLRFGWELARRVVRIRIEPGPASRNFLHPNLLAWIIQHRAEVLYHLLVLVNAWLASGRPGPAAGTPDFESFDSWRAVVGGIMNTAGLSFLANLEDARLLADRESVTVRAFVETWQSERGRGPAFAADLLPIARNLIELPAHEHAATIKLGLFLSKYENQIHCGWRIRRLATSKGKTPWQLEAATRE